MPMTRRLLMLGSTGAAACASLPKQQHAPYADDARALAQQLKLANLLPAISLAVVRENDLLWAEAFGEADLELAVPAGVQHRFRLGSVSKIVTASLAAKLADRGVVALDTPIATYMPDLPEQHRATTLRQLLTHRGGVRHYTDRDNALDDPGPIDFRTYANAADILATFINDPLIAPPGTQVSYSTFGYTLISIVLETATSQSFLDLVREEIATPLGLASLGFDGQKLVQPNRVRGYSESAQFPDDLPRPEGPWANAPIANIAYKFAGGGMIATPTDLAKFGAAHITPGVFSPEMLSALFAVQTQATERSPPLGLGWRINQDERGRLRWHHAGVQDGARASLVVYPAERLSIAMATNLTAKPGDVLAPSSQLADIFARQSSDRARISGQ